MATVVSGQQPKQQPLVLRPRFLIPFAIAVVVLLSAVLYGIARPHNHVRLQGPGTTNKLHWGGGVFTSKAELRAWLNAHGKSYAAFAKAHPAAVRMLPAETAKP